jgi:hypothetical protein
LIPVFDGMLAKPQRALPPIKEGTSFNIYNLLGQGAKNVENIKNNTIDLDLTGLESGLYFYTIGQNEKVLLTSKFIKD